MSNKYRKIGKGSFSSVYRKNNENTVLIVSRDCVKECMSLGWFPNSKLFPNVEYLSTNNNGTKSYKMKYYDKITAPKKQLNKRSYKLYKALRELEVDMPVNLDLLYEKWVEAFQSLPNEFKTARTALIEAVEGLMNYGGDIAFEISPRNIAATKTGNLVLLDCFLLCHNLDKF